MAALLNPRRLTWRWMPKGGAPSTATNLRARHVGLPKTCQRIDIEPDANPPIVRDSQHPAFFAAIIKQDDTAMPRQVDLAAWRDYVLHNGPLPKRPAAEPAFPIRTRQREGLRKEPPPAPPSAA